MCVYIYIYGCPNSPWEEKQGRVNGSYAKNRALNLAGKRPLQSHDGGAEVVVYLTLSLVIMHIKWVTAKKQKWTNFI